MEDKDIVFVGGLSRSGSTVTCNILQQHPSIFTVPTDPIAQTINEIITAVVEQRIGQAFHREVWDKGLYEFVDRGLQGYYNSFTDKPVIISKNRKYWSRLTHVFKQTKHIVCLRDLFDVLDSHVRFEHSNHIVTPTIEGGYFLAGLNDFGAVKNYLSHFAALDWHIPRYIEMQDRNPDQVMFVRYEDLLSNPNSVLEDINNFIGVDQFTYDLCNIQQSSIYEHDGVYGGDVDHVVRPTLSKSNDKPLLNEEWRGRIINNERFRWYYQTFYPELL